MPSSKKKDRRVSDCNMATISANDLSIGEADNEDVFSIEKKFGAFIDLKNEKFSLHESVRNGAFTLVDRMLETDAVFRLVNQADESTQTPLHFAAKANNLSMCKLLIEKGEADASIRDSDGATPLHYACRRKLLGHNRETNAVIKLLASHCNNNFSVPDRYGSTTLHFAAMRGNVAAAMTLITHNRDMLELADQYGCTPLHEAATYNEVEVAELLIRYGSDITARDLDKCTPLHLACGGGSLEMVNLLIDKCEGTSMTKLIDSKDKEDATALHYAIEAKSLEIIKLLIEKGAHVNQHCRWKTSGSTALHLAAVAGDEDITEYLIKAGAMIKATDNSNGTPLHAAAQYDCKGVSDILLKKLGNDVNQTDVNGRTPLLVAAKYGSVDILTDLLKVKADVSVSDKYEKNVLHLAVENLQEDVLRIFIEHIKGTSSRGLVNEQDYNGQNPLHLAAQKGNLDIVEMLLDAGADLTCKDETEETPFLQAAETGRAEVIRTMLDRTDTVINDEDEFSNTALHKAAERGHVEVAKMLVEWGAVKEARNHRSQTALDVASAEGHAAMVQYLLGEGVPPNPKDKTGTIPLHLAAQFGHSNTVKSLITGGADVAAVNSNGHNCLDIAIANGHRNVVIAILKSPMWHVALANETCHEKEKPRMTPLRKLVQKMPDVAPIALTRCVTEKDDPRKREYLEFNYDYIDDSCTDYTRLQADYRTPQLDDRCLPTGSLYTEDKNWIKQNHPLTILCSGHKTEHEDLIGHPLVLALIRHKWMACRVFYFLFLSYYSLYVGMLTAYMVDADAPYFRRNLTACRADGTDYQSNFQKAAMIIIWVMSALGIIIEIIQAISQGWLYFAIINLVDWYTYISASVLMAEIPGNCGLKTDWQWQMGAFTVLFAWLGMLLFLRRLPGLGIYVVMIVEILKTFMKFFFVFFLFVVAFAMSYHILLQNQSPFSTPFYSITKTWVMMLGEMDYTDIIHVDPSERPVYEAATFAVFWLFMMLLAIIIMNLLTGLAVDDVNLLQKRAKIVKLQLQVELALDIELAMPKIWRNSTKSIVRREHLYKKSDSSAFWRVMENIQIAVEGPLLSRSVIVEAANDMTESSGTESVELQRLEDRVTQHIFSSNEQMQLLYRKLDHMDHLLQGIARHSGGNPGQLSIPATPKRGRSPRSSRDDGRRRDDLPEVSAKPPIEKASLKKKMSSIISGMSFGRQRSVAGPAEDKTPHDPEPSREKDHKDPVPKKLDDLALFVAEVPGRSRPRHISRQSDKTILIESDEESETTA